VVEPQERKLSFREADQRFAALEQQHSAGALSDEEFESRVRDLMVQDGTGRWWAKSRSTGEWYYRDVVTNEWVKGVPPDYDTEHHVPPPPPPPPPQSPPWLKRAVFAVLAALVLIGLVAVFPLTRGDRVPKLVGQTISEARREAGDEYQIDISDVSVRSEVKGTIIDQDPDPGKPAEQGSVISVIVSAGQPSNPGDILRDKFSDNSSGLPRDHGPESYPWSYNYELGFYRMFLPPDTPNYLTVLHSDSGTPRNAIVEVDATVTGDLPENTDSNWGVMCRAQDAESGYVFLIYPNAVGGIFKIEKGKATTRLAISSPSDAINRGTRTNHLRADCLGNELTLYVNGHKIVDAKDSTFDNGQVGLSMETAGNDKLDVLFDNLVASTP